MKGLEGEAPWSVWGVEREHRLKLESMESIWQCSQCWGSLLKAGVKQEIPRDERSRRQRAPK